MDQRLKRHTNEKEEENLPKKYRLPMLMNVQSSFPEYRAGSHHAVRFHGRDIFCFLYLITLSNRQVWVERCFFGGCSLVLACFALASCSMLRVQIALPCRAAPFRMELLLGKNMVPTIFLVAAYGCSSERPSSMSHAKAGVALRFRSAPLGSHHPPRSTG